MVDMVRSAAEVKAIGSMIDDLTEQARERREDSFLYAHIARSGDHALGGLGQIVSLLERLEAETASHQIAEELSKGE